MKQKCEASEEKIKELIRHLVWEIISEGEPPWASTTQK